MAVRLLVDGNNLMFALADVAVEADRRRLSRMLGDFARREGAEVTVVYDGPRRRPSPADNGDDPRLTVYYSEGRTADEILAELIASHSAPRRLTIVSGDRAVQRQARRRRCQVVEALAFARQLKVRPRRATPQEPGAKQEGLGDGEADQWLREFGLQGNGDFEREQ